MILRGRYVDVLAVLWELGLEVNSDAEGDVVTRCPWPENHRNGDRHPSFAVSLESGAWICYTGCGSGSLTRLVAQYKEYSADEALRWVLAVGSGIMSFEKVELCLQGRPEDSSRERRIVEQKAQADYELMDPAKTSSYFLERGFTRRTIREWGIRYDSTLRAVVLPIYEASGRQVVGVARRFVPPLVTGCPKYLYTKGFQRERHLFGAHRHPRDGAATVLVEGPLDALWLHQLGITSAVALMGSYCSKAQVRLLQCLGSRVTLLLDSDAAGQAATARLVQELGAQFGLQVGIITEGKDVQELTKSQVWEVLANVAEVWRRYD